MEKNEKRTWLLSAGLFVLFFALFLIGYKSAEVSLVFRKAIAICMECIGIG